MALNQQDVGMLLYTQYRVYLQGSMNHGPLQKAKRERNPIKWNNFFILNFRFPSRLPLNSENNK
jgi:hypothetical protein